MRGCAVLQRVQQKAELELGFVGRDLESVKDFLLHVGAMDTHRAAAHFPAVEHHVVALGNAFLGGSDHPVLVAVFGCGKRVVRGGVALRFFVVLEHGEIHHPHGAPASFEQTVLLAELAMTDFQAQGANRVVDDFFFVCAKEDQVAVLGTGAGQHFGNRLVVDVFHDRALQTVAALGHFVHADVGQAFGAVNLDELGVSVNLAAADAAALHGTTGHAQGHHTAAFHIGGA